MKHLKRFNESSDYEQDAIEFIKMYLSDLIDKGNVNIRVEKSGLNDETFKYIAILSLGVGPNMKNWGEIKDSFLPFLEMFIREYGDIKDIKLLGRTSLDVETYDYYELIRDEDLIDDKYLVRAIKFLF